MPLPITPKALHKSACLKEALPHDIAGLETKSHPSKCYVVELGACRHDQHQEALDFVLFSLSILLQIVRSTWSNGMPVCVNGYAMLAPRVLNRLSNAA